MQRTHRECNVPTDIEINTLNNNKMAYKFKYLIFKNKPFNTGETVAIFNVSHLNKKGIDTRWEELQKEFTPEQYASCLTECNHRMAEYNRKAN